MFIKVDAEISPSRKDTARWFSVEEVQEPLQDPPVIQYPEERKRKEK